MNHLKMACNHTMNSSTEMNMSSTMKMDMSMMNMKSNHLQYSNTNQRTSTTGTTATTTNGNDIFSIRTRYLAGLPQGSTVNYQNAVALQTFFATPMGAAVLNYFAARAVQPNGQKGLNVYGLTDANYRLWMGIKILSGTDTNLYARSLTIDQNLFT